MKKKGLPSNAYTPLAEGEQYQPYVPATQSPAEFTLRAVATGAVLGILFGAANAYLGLKAGLTISTSIPVAVLTVAVFRGRSGQGTQLLEANMSQTIGSASSSVASGVIFTLPALFLWGMIPSLTQMTLLALCGGLLGVLFMIPLRRFLIQGEHGNLPYPEGTACAEVLVASEAGGSSARNVFWGLAMGAVVKFFTGWSKLIPGKVTVDLPFLKKGQLGGDVSAALFGVGYILGPRISAIMVGGGLLSWLVMIPIIATWGEGRSTPLFPEAVNLIRDMEPKDLWTRYVRYIGAGAVAMGGLITLIKSIPVMVQSFRIGTRELRSRVGATETAQVIARTAADLPLKTVGIGAGIIALVLALVPQAFGEVPHGAARPVAAVLVVLFAFFFVTVASRIVGLVGVTSNPTSGMTIASLLGTSLLFLMLGWTDAMGKAAALTVGCVVAIAASISGDTSQDLKTGFLLGGTPRLQQTGELIGVMASAFFVCWAVRSMHFSTGFGTDELPAPQATLMKLVIEGVLDRQLPWVLVGIGASIALLAEIFRLPSLPFAVGIYLPVATMVPVFFGGMLRYWMERSASSKAEAEGRRERGVLLGSGLVGGEGLLGVAMGAAAAIAVAMGKEKWEIGSAWAGSAAPFLGFAFFLALVGWFAWRCRRADA